MFQWPRVSSNEHADSARDCTMSDPVSPTPPVASVGQRPALPAQVDRIFDHCADTRSIFLRMSDGTLPQFTPGMFISVAIPLATETRIRPYTIASSPEDG